MPRRHLKNGSNPKLNLFESVRAECRFFFVVVALAILIVAVFFIRGKMVSLEIFPKVTDREAGGNSLMTNIM